MVKYIQTQVKKNIFFFLLFRQDSKNLHGEYTQKTVYRETKGHFFLVKVYRLDRIFRFFPFKQCCLKLNLKKGPIIKFIVDFLAPIIYDQKPKNAI